MADSNLEVNINGRDDLTPLLNGLESRIIRFVGFVSSALATVKVAAFPIAATADFQRELANVQKTTEFTASAMVDLADRLKDLSLRSNVSVVDLTKIAAAAGQQGLGGTGVAGVVKFTESVARMATVLDVSAEDAATNVGKLLNIFHLGVNDTERIASAFNETSNNSTASGHQLLDIVRRIGDAAGTINLKQSLGLAATGIDFGLSPEVVGTSFQSIFIQMRSKAPEFAKLIKTTLGKSFSTKEWTELLAKDGIAAYKLYLQALRKLDSQSQADRINKLSGQGRIAGLVNKSIADTSDSVLNKNLANADTGFTGGMSAIKEQQKVLATFTEQTNILKNSLFTLGTEVGGQLVPQLTAYVAQLAETLQAPGVKSFMRAIGASFLDLISLFHSGASALGALNVNWENFITVIKVFLGVRLIEAFGTLAARLPIISGLLNRVGLSAAAAGGAISNAAAQNSDALGRWTNSIREFTQARTQQAEADARAASAARQAQSREADYLRQMRQEQAVNNVANGALANAGAARQTTANVRTAATTTVDNLTGTLAARRAAAEAESEARISAIQQQYRGQRRVAQVAARDAEIAAEEAALTRRLAGYESYYQRQIRLAQTNGVQLIAQAEQEEARLTEIARVAQEQRLAAQNRSNVARQQMEGTDGAARVAQAEADAAAQNANRAGGAARNVGAILGAVGAGLVRLISFAAGAFLWLTILYTILDSLGIIDKLAPMFTRLTDAIGLTSESSRRAAQASKDLADALEKEKKRANELTDAYNKLKDANTGRLDKTKVSAVVNNLQSDNPEARNRTIGSLGENLIAAKTDVSAQGVAATTAANADRTAKLNANLVILKKNSEDAARSYKSLASQLAAGVGGVNQTQVDAAKDKLAEVTAQYKDASAAAQQLSVNAKSGSAEVLAQAKSNQETITSLVSGLFTDKSADLFEKYVVPINKTQAELDKLSEKAAKALVHQSAASNPEDAAKYEAEAIAAGASMEALQVKLVAMQNAFNNARDALLGEKGLTKVENDAINGLTAFGGQRTDVLTAYLDTIKQMRAAGAKLTGENNPVLGDGKKTGDVTLSPGGDSEERKMARARFEQAKAEAQAAAALQKELNDQLLKVDQDYYDHGLTDIRTYFAQRKQLQLADNDTQIKALRAEAAQAAKERAGRKADNAPESELMRYTTDITRINGQIAELTAKRKGIAADNAKEIRDAEKTLAASINSAQLQVMDALGVTDLDSYLGEVLTSASAQYEDFWAKLASEGGAANEKLANDLHKLVDIQAFSKVFDKIGQSIDRSYSALDLWLSRLNVLRETGQLTTAEYESASARYRAEEAAKISAAIASQTEALATMKRAGLAGNEEYDKLALTLDQSKVKLVQLQTTANQVALEINASLRSGIQDALNTLLTGPVAQQLNSAQQAVLSDNNASVRRLQDSISFLERARTGVIGGYSADNANLDAQIAKSKQSIADLKEESRKINAEATESIFSTIVRAAEGLAKTVATAIKDAATKNLSEMAVKSLGSAGGGGIGGMIAGVLGGSAALGSSADKAMWVQMADGGGAAALAAKAANPDAKKSLTEGVQEAWTATKTKVSDVFSSITSSLSSTFSSVSSSLGGIFSSIGHSLSSVFSGLFGGSGGGAGGIGSVIAGLFHSGGVVGSSFTPRMASAGMFAHATRYHSGGIAGLAADEVPAILRKGEEVLMANDPRHRNNASGGDTTNVAVTVNMETGSSKVTADDGQARALGQQISVAVQKEIINQKRPGGLLSNG